MRSKKIILLGLCAITFLVSSKSHAAVCKVSTLPTATYTTIQEAINDTSCSTIRVKGGTYYENLTIDRNVVLEKQPSLTSTLVINGSTGTTSVVTITSGNVTLSNLTITGGSAGGISNTGSGDLVLNSVTVSSNTHTVGLTSAAGLYQAAGSLTITKSNFENNTNLSGVSALYVNGGDTVSISDTTFQGDDNGQAALYFDAVDSITITGSTIEETDSYYSSIEVKDYNSLTLEKTTVTGSPYMALYLDRGSEKGITQIESSTISDNDEAGLFYDNLTCHKGIQPKLTVKNSTFSGNGGGLFMRCDGSSGKLTGTQFAVSIESSTFVENDSAFYAYYEDPSMSLHNTIVAENTTNCGTTGGVSKVTSKGYNLDDDGSCASGSTDLSDAPDLESLADNGGSTETHMPQSTSPVIDAGDPSSCLTTDQRGAARPYGSACDIGAVEYGASI